MGDIVPRSGEFSARPRLFRRVHCDRDADCEFLTRERDRDYVEDNGNNDRVTVMSLMNEWQRQWRLNLLARVITTREEKVILRLIRNY